MLLCLYSTCGEVIYDSIDRRGVIYECIQRMSISQTPLAGVVI
jgi:hypothetical protein